MKRNIPRDDKDFIKQYGEDADANTISTISILIKRKYLKIHEARRTMAKNANLNLEDALKKTNSIEPLSVEMIEVLEKQSENV